MNGIMKIVQALENFNILLKGVTKTIKNETKEQKGGFLSMLLGTLGASLLENLLSGKGIVRAGFGKKKRKRYCKIWLWKRMRFWMPPHPLTNFEIPKCHENEPKFNGVFSICKMPKKIKDGENVINLYQYENVDTHWIALFCNKSDIIYFDSFRVEHVPEEIKEFVVNKNIKANIFRVQAKSLVMCVFFYIGFIDFMLAGQKLTVFTSFFSPLINPLD